MSANLPTPKIRVEIYHGATTVVPVDENLTHKDVCNLEITLPILSRGIGGATFKLQNFNSTYTGLIAEHDKVAIWLYRTGETATKVFGGRISKLSYEGISGAPEYYMYVECMDYGEQLQVPPSLFSKSYTNVNGKTILTDAIALCPDLVSTHVDPNNQIATTHTVNYEEVPPWDVVREIMDVVKKADGSTGFDGYIDPTGDVYVFPRGANTSTVDLTDKILYYRRDGDTYRVKNKIKVYGSSGKSFPSDLDSWSESLNGWTMQSGYNLSLDATIKRKGNYSLYCGTPSGGGEINIYRTFDALSKYQTFVVWIRIPGNLGGGYSYVRLWAPNSSNYFQADIKSLLEGKCILQWGLISLALGSNQMYNVDNNPNGIWTVGAGNPQWSQISGLQLIIDTVGATSYANFDGDFGFLNGPYTGIAEDSNSEALYGVCMPSPTSDATLQSDAECLKSAEALIKLYKDKVVTWNVRTLGNNAFKPGDMQPIVIANDNINESFRILEVRHKVEDVYWETVLI
jgi:hypothetical protein